MTNVVSLSFVALQLVCGNPDGWSFHESVRTLEPGVEELTITLERAEASVPPQFFVLWNLPQKDLSYYWHPGATQYGIPPDWSRRDDTSNLASWAPLYSLFSDSNENRLAVATDDAKRLVGFRARLREEDCRVYCRWNFFGQKARPSVREVIRRSSISNR